MLWKINKDVEKISTGVSTNENDINFSYNKKPSSEIKPIDLEQKKVENTLTFSQMVEKKIFHQILNFPHIILN